MPIPLLVGSGIMPAAGPVLDELAAITHRRFIPKLVVQIYQSTPLIQALIDNAQFASGGVDPITVPIQGASLVTGSWVGYGGNFALPGSQTGITNAQATLKLFVVPIPFLGMEGAVQMNAEVVSLIEARLNDATSVTKKTLAQALVGNTAALNPLALTGLLDAVDDGTNTDSYEGISRAANPFWKSFYINAQGAVPTRNLIMQYMAQIVKATGEMPTFGVGGVGTWTMLTQDFTGLERYNLSPSSGGFSHVSSLFRSLDVAGVPIYADPYMSEGRIFFLNMNYLSLYIHEAAAFQFSGFHTAIPNGQIGFVGVMAVILELVSTKPSTMSQITNLNFLPI